MNPVPINCVCDVPQRVTLRVLDADTNDRMDKDNPIMIQIETLEVQPPMQSNQKNF